MNPAAAWRLAWPLVPAPLLAVLGSFGQTALLGGDLFGLHFAGLAYPRSFIILFAAGAPIMGMAALFSQFFHVAPVEQEPSRAAIAEVVGLLVGLPLMFASVVCMHFAGHTAVAPGTQFSSTMLLRVIGYICAIVAALAFIYHFRSILQQRVLLLATLVTILVYAGNVIPSNMNLYSAERVICLRISPARRTCSDSASR